jgi:hypothetical protein
MGTPPEGRSAGSWWGRPSFVLDQVSKPPHWPLAPAVAARCGRTVSSTLEADERFGTWGGLSA